MLGTCKPLRGRSTSCRSAGVRPAAEPPCDLSGILAADNNHAERQIGPAVIQRKAILCNRSPEGTEGQAVLMSVYRGLTLQGHDPTRTVAAALRELVLAGTLPPLPEPVVAGG